jgi:hypothetical protein
MTFAGVDDVVVRDLASGQDLVIPATLDGHFETIIPVNPGTNSLEFRFSAMDSDKVLAKQVSLVVQTNTAVLEVEP